MESIKSTEVLGRVSASLGEAPVHTEEDHKRCAYYINLAEGVMQCPHGELATGAFYSEDYVNEMRRTMHQFLASFRASNPPITGITKTLLQKVIDLTR
jgi:hypothetical protein